MLYVSVERLSASVRFLDNFSAGTRGAASAEHFLRSGRYAVIFLHRQFSLQPFTRHYSHSTNPFLDLLEIEGENDEKIVADFVARCPQTDACGPLFPPLPVRRGRGQVEEDGVTSDDPNESSKTICVSGLNAQPMRDLLRSYKLVKGLGLLHSINFVTVHDYLFLLRGVSEILGNVGRKAMYYLAAAVSDFFIPQQKMVSFSFPGPCLRSGSR
jgi:phosphopantothenate-cysteine ligase